VRLKAKGISPISNAVTSESYQEKDLLWNGDEPVLTPCPHKVPLNIKELSSALEVDGLLAQALPGYEHRQEQLSMMQAVVQAFNNDAHLMVEAGTGTGKSIAYLLPSLLFSSQNGLPVVISTNTINLQEQLINKDIPDLLQTLEFGGQLKAVQVKGRTNYLCRRRLTVLETSDKLSDEEAKFVARIKIWLESTQSGDRTELNLNSREIPIWNKICAQAGDRLEAECPYQQRGSCFLHRARKSATNAHIIVVNHALLISDMISDAKILPEYNYLIIDEAHHLEEEATRQLGYQLTQWDIFDYLNRFQQEARGKTHTGILSQIDNCLRSYTMAISRKRQLQQLTESANKQLEKIRMLTYQFWDKLRDSIVSHASDYGEYDRQLRLTLATRTQAGWSGVENSWKGLNVAFKSLAEDLNRLYLSLEDMPQNTVSGHDYILSELSYLFRRNQELRNQIDSLVSNPERDNIYWLTLNEQGNTVNISSAPLSVSKFLEQYLFSAKNAVILTSATLSTEGTFEYIKERLGLEYINELILGAPFDYLQSAIAYLVHDIPKPGNAHYQQSIEKALIALCSASRGRTLVLFTSHSSLKATQGAIQTPLEEEGILVLGQGVNGSPKQLLATFRTNPRTVILGTASLWEGIDVVGEALSVLVIVRLPFNVPTEPVFAARSELFDDSFNQYSLPQAVLRFKQGFGRLIRSKTDRGAMAVLDSRLCSSQYGSAFLDSIPLCTVIKGSSSDLPTTVAGWLNVG